MVVLKQTRTRTVIRYVAGRPLDGYRRTDATWLRPGTRSLVGEPAARWWMWAGWKRSLVRLGLPPALVVLVVATVLWPAWVATVAAGLAALGLGLAGRRVRIWWRFRQHSRQYVNPLARTLAPILGVDKPRVSVPISFQLPEMETTIWLPPNVLVGKEMQAAILLAVKQRLGLSDPDVEWSTQGARPLVRVKPPAAPPASLSWARMADVAAQAPETAPVLGLGPRELVVDADLDADSPHVAVSGGSGSGKSVLTKSLVAQGLRHGSGAVILDYKRSSQRWAQDLPGVIYAKDIADIHDVCVAIGEEGERRNVEADEDPNWCGHRIFILVEEWNALAGKLHKYWASIREKDDPKTSPAVEAISDITFMGRHVKMNVIGVAQLLSARTTGGPETRENFATRCLARYTVNAWKMLAPEVWPAPRKSKVRGRWQIVKNGEAIETQVAFMTDEEAREWALGGVPAPHRVLGGVAPRRTPSSQWEDPGTVPGAGRELVGLRDAGLALGVSLDRLRKWRTRDSDHFPREIDTMDGEKRYDLEEIRTYVRRRDAISASKEGK